MLPSPHKSYVASQCPWALFHETAVYCSLVWQASPSSLLAEEGLAHQPNCSLTFAFSDFVEFKGEDDVIRILTELADKALPSAERATLDVGHRISKHWTQVLHLHTAFDLHTNKIITVTINYFKTRCLVPSVISYTDPPSLPLLWWILP